MTGTKLLISIARPAFQLDHSAAVLEREQGHVPDDLLDPRQAS